MSADSMAVLEEVRNNLPENVAYVVDESASAQDKVFVPPPEILNVVEELHFVRPILVKQRFPVEQKAETGCQDMPPSILNTTYTGIGNTSDSGKAEMSGQVYRGILDEKYTEAIIEIAMSRPRLDPARLSWMGRLLASRRDLASELGCTLPTPILAKHLSEICGEPVNRMATWRYLNAYKEAGLITPLPGKVFISKHKERENCPFFIAQEPLLSAVLLHAPEKRNFDLPSTISDGTWDSALYAGANYYYPNLDAYFAWVFNQSRLFISSIKRSNGIKENTNRPLKAARAWTRIEQFKFGTKEDERKRREKELYRFIQNRKGEIA